MPPTTTPPDRSDLTVSLSIRIPGAEPFQTKSRPLRTGPSEYPIVVNIDGQGAEWLASCTEDYIDGIRNPAGAGKDNAKLESRIAKVKTKERTTTLTLHSPLEGPYARDRATSGNRRSRAG